MESYIDIEELRDSVKSLHLDNSKNFCLKTY